MRFRHLLPVVIAAGALLVPSVAGASPQRSGSSTGTSASSSSKSAGQSSSTGSSSTSSSKKASSASAGVAAGKATHIVRSGDTVVGIAKKYGVSADSVRAANGIVDDELYLGARLIIDGSAGGSSKGSSSKSGTKDTSNAKRISSVTSAGGSYTVVEGDYLDGIARKHGVSLKALLSANGLKATSLILPGDDLKIPGGSSSSSSAGSSSGSSTSSSSVGSSAGDVGTDLRCPVPGASFMNDWGFPRDGGVRFHEGTDMFAPKGTTIVAPASGTVVYGTNGLGGNTFTLTTSSGWVIYGAHLSAAVGSSRAVRAGEAIGRVGSSGNAAGGATHLHIQLKRVGGSSINPYPSVKAACG